LPSLSQLVTFREFAELRTGFAGSAVYDVSFLAADFLIGKVGLPAVVNYFRLFSLSDDRAETFRPPLGKTFPRWKTGSPHTFKSSWNKTGTFAQDCSVFLI